MRSTLHDAIMPTRLLNEKEVAAILNVSVATIRRRRLFNQPPVFRKIGASVRYHPDDVAAWIDAQPMGGNPRREGER